MAEAKFTYEGQDIIIQCNENQKMKEICTNLSNKVNVGINSLIFLYGGTKLNLEKTFKEITKENKISIIVYKYENEEICPKCGRILGDEMINEIISSNNNVNSSLKGIKRQIELIMIDLNNKVDINDIISQLKNINILINNINEDIKKMNNKLNRIQLNDSIIIKSNNTNNKKEEKLESENDSNDFENKLDKQMYNIEEKIIVKKNQQSLYTYYNFSQKFKNDPRELIFKKDICFDAHTANSIDSVFCAFTSFNKEALIVWGSTSYNIEFYDCNLEKIIKTFFHAHNDTVFSCRHYPDSKQRIDYIISSSKDRTVKVWDYTKNQYILNINDVYQGSYIYSVSLLCHILKDNKYIITSCPYEKMRIWDFNGSFLRDFGQNDESNYFIDVFYDKIAKKYYILNANSSDVKSYDFHTGNLFKRYKGSPQTWHMSVVINYIEENVVLIESDGKGYIRIWNFNTAELLKTIDPHSSFSIRGICQWNDRYLFGAGSDNQVKLFDLVEGKYVTSFESHTSTVYTIEKIMHPKYGECLVTQALDGKLKLWAAKKE